MPVFIAFLRAVNVGGRAYPMAELRAVLEEAGFEDVETHIQTGNVRLRTSLRSKDKLAAALEKVFEDDRGFAVPTIVLTPSEVAAVVADADDLPAPEFAHYVELMRSAPSAAGTKTIEEQEFDKQRAVVRGRAVHLLFDKPYHDAKGPTAAARKAIGDSTNRNVKVMRAIAEKWGS